MNYFNAGVLLSSLFLFSCNQAENKPGEPLKETVNHASEVSDDRTQIRDLIRHTLNWADSDNSIDLLPMLTDSKDSVYTGFDLDIHQNNLEKLKQTGFFATGFIDNYNQIIKTLDRKIKNNEMDPWLVGYLPTFNFQSDYNAWSLGQDVPYDKPNPWDCIEVEITNLEKGEAKWRWGKPELISEPGWKQFRYKFRVVKEDHKWKIAYLEGFDFKEATKS